MLAYLSLGPEGEIYVNEGNDEQGNHILTVSPMIMIALGMWNEARLGHSYAQDATRAATIVEWMLYDIGYTVDSRNDLLKSITMICEPGPGYLGASVNLTERCLNDAELMNAEVHHDGSVTKSGKKISLRQLYEAGLMTAKEVRQAANPKATAF